MYGNYKLHPTNYSLTFQQRKKTGQAEGKKQQCDQKGN